MSVIDQNRTFAVPTSPYAPPKATVADIQQPPQSRVARYVVAALVPIQLILNLYYIGTYFELVRTGAAHPLVLLLGIPGSLCLYLATILGMIRGSRGKRLFLIGGVLLALCVPFWLWPYPPFIITAFGAALGFAGWWLALRSSGPVKSA